MADDLRTQPDRDRVAALIAAADRLATPLDFAVIDRRPIRRGGILAAIAVALTLVGLVAVTTLGGGGDATADDRISTTTDDGLVRSPPATTAVAASAGPVPVRAAAPGATTAAGAVASDTTTSDTTVSAPTTSATSTAMAAAPDPAGEAAPVRYAVYSDGKVYLRGRVPDRATATAIREKAATVLGAENVVDEYVIDPDAPRPRSAPLYVADALLFAPDSDELTQAARGLVDLGIALLQLYPGVTWTIEGHTDSLGSDSYNLELSQRRLDAIVAYIAVHGVDTRRVTTIAKGESEPIADNATRAGRAQNRRIEVVIEGLLG
ncbi:MAG: OmpA family protein [Acidimicrobiia bacterium]